MRVRLALLAVIFGSWFGSLWVGSLFFPHGFDWRRNVISNLLSPRYNPGWFWLPSAGVVVAGLCMLPLAAWIESELRDGENRLASRARGPALLLGIVCLILAAVVPQDRSFIWISHDLLALTSVAGLTVGMVCACQSAGPGIGVEGERGRRLRALRMIWWATMIPIMGAVVSRLASLHGSVAAAPAGYFRGTVFYQIAFWEWIGSVAVYLFFASPVLMLGGTSAKRD